MKHWWRKRSACRWIASTTGPKRWPVFWQAIPPAKSTKTLPSGSVTRAPSADETTSRGVEKPADTYCARRARISDVLCCCSIEVMRASMTEQTRNVEGCLPRIAQRSSCGGEADAFRGCAPPQAGSERGIPLLRNPACEQGQCGFPHLAGRTPLVRWRRGDTHDRPDRRRSPELSRLRTGNP